MLKEIKNTNQIDVLMDELGDIAFSLDLQTNVLWTAHFIFEYYEKPFANRFVNIYLIELGSFYELFFKYKLSLINKSLVWNNPKEYNKEKHDKAAMKTISADLTLCYACNFGWIDESEKSMINNIKEIRNKLIHFSACEPSEEENVWRCEIIKGKDIRYHLKLIKRLFEDNKDDFANHPHFKVMQKEKTYLEA